MAKKKILCFIDGLDSGGAQRQLVGLADVLLQSGLFDVLIVAYKKNADFYSDQLKAKGIPFIIEKKYGMSRIRGFRVLRRHCQLFGPDLIISFLGETNLFASIYHIINKVPLIVSERNTIVDPTLFDKIRFILYKWVDCIVPNSYSQGKYIANNYPKLMDKIKTIVNFVDTDRFKPNYGLRQENLDWLRMIVVARVQPQKNVLNFIRSLSKVGCNGEKKIVVDWYGDLSNSKYVNECKTLCGEMGVDSILTFRGEVQNVLEQYVCSDVLCLPSLYEGTPNVICEAMACGLPILCSDVCDNCKYVENDVNGYRFDPVDPEDIANKINMFMQLDKTQRQSMSRKSRSMAEELFSKEKFAEEWISVIKKITKL